jgi:hypothetical protein
MTISDQMLLSSPSCSKIGGALCDKVHPYLRTTRPDQTGRGAHRAKEGHRAAAPGEGQQVASNSIPPSEPLQVTSGSDRKTTPPVLPFGTKPNPADDAVRLPESCFWVIGTGHSSVIFRLGPLQLRSAP